MRALELSAEWNPRPGHEPSDAERSGRTATNASTTWRHPTLELVERDRPTPAPDEALVRVRYAGICGSDISLVETDEEGYTRYTAYASLPTVLGHEFSGEVVQTGSDAHLFSEGDLVTAEVTDYCGRCRMCRQGFRGHCDDFDQLGFTVPGAFAEYVVVPEKLLWDVSTLRNVYDSKDDVLRAGATVEPSTITYYGLFGRAAGIVPGDYYVFHGAGPIGLTGMNVARAAGAGKVIAFEPSPQRRAIARELGFEYVFDPTSGDPSETVMAVTGGEGADVHVEAAGAVHQTYPVIEDSLAEQANVVHISNTAASPTVDLRKYQGNSAQLYGSEGHTGHQTFPRVIRLMAAGHLDNLPLVTATYDLSNAEEAIEQASRRVDGKVLIEA